MYARIIDGKVNIFEICMKCKIELYVSLNTDSNFLNSIREDKPNATYAYFSPIKAWCSCRCGEESFWADLKIEELIKIVKNPVVKYPSAKLIRGSNRCHET